MRTLKHVTFLGFGAVILMSLLFSSAAWGQVQEIKIGVLYPITGGAAAAGRELVNGAELAAELANNITSGIDMDFAKTGGIKGLGGAKIKLIFKDHEGNPTLGADLAKKLILDDKVVGIQGCYQSSVTKAVAAVCEQYGVPMVSDRGSSPTLTRQGYKWFWRTQPHDEIFTKELFEFLGGLKAGKARGVKAVPANEIMNLASACENTEWGSNVSSVIEAYAKDYKYNLKKAILYSAKSADLSSEVRSLKAVNPDAMLFACYTTDGILMVKTLKAERAKPKIIWGQNAGFETPEFPKTLGDDVIGILTRTAFLPKLGAKKKVAAQLNDLQRKKKGADLSGDAAMSFVGTQTWAHILDKAKSTKPADIQRAANEIHISGEQLAMPWAGVKFSTSGKDIGQNELGSGTISQYQKNKAGMIEMEILYPFDLATADMIYPFKAF